MSLICTHKHTQEKTQLWKKTSIKCVRFSINYFLQIFFIRIFVFFLLSFSLSLFLFFCVSFLYFNFVILYESWFCNKRNAICLSLFFFIFSQIAYVLNFDIFFFFEINEEKILYEKHSINNRVKSKHTATHAHAQIPLKILNLARHINNKQQLNAKSHKNATNFRMCVCPLTIE